jgi:tRNA 2-selenouridine synthase
MGPSDDRNIQNREVRMPQPELPLIDDYASLFLDDRPLLDVRAPVEFAEGSFPAAQNHPLLDDEQRHQIGLRYAEDGQDAAIALGEALATPSVRSQRVAPWIEFARHHPNGVLYCFRGGMRSAIAQRWLYEASGIAYPRVKGGYKALRQFLLEEIERAAEEAKFLVIGGRTGSGKTLFLRAQTQPMLDLEALAWHRGSAFGRHATPQPRQIDFEHHLAIELLRHRHRHMGPLLVEDEGKTIGSIHQPPRLYQRIKQSPLLILEATERERVLNSVQEYVIDTLAEYQSAHGVNEGFALWSNYVLDSLGRIQRRLGGVRYQALDSAAKSALQQHRQDGDPWVHQEWIATLLHQYYDPMYDYQMSNNRHRIVFTGDRQALQEFIQHGAYDI